MLFELAILNFIEVLTRCNASLSSTPSRSFSLGLGVSPKSSNADLEEVGKLLDHVVAALILGDVVVAKLLERFRDLPRSSSSRPPSAGSRI